MHLTYQTSGAASVTMNGEYLGVVSRLSNGYAAVVDGVVIGVFPRQWMAVNAVRERCF
jgi:hypothetical protein